MSQPEEENHYRDPGTPRRTRSTSSVRVGATPTPGSPVQFRFERNCEILEPYTLYTWTLGEPKKYVVELEKGHHGNQWKRADEAAEHWQGLNAERAKALLVAQIHTCKPGYEKYWPDVWSLEKDVGSDKLLLKVPHPEPRILQPLTIVHDAARDLGLWKTPEVRNFGRDDLKPYYSTATAVSSARRELSTRPRMLQRNPGAA